MKLELDMERWEEEHKDIDREEKEPGCSWASSVSLASEMSEEER